MKGKTIEIEFTIDKEIADNMHHTDRTLWQLIKKAKIKGAKDSEQVWKTGENMFGKCILRLFV